MAYSWYNNVFLPAEYRALLRDCEKEIADGSLTKEEADKKVTDWQDWVMSIEREAKETDMKEYAEKVRRELLGSTEEF